MPLAHNHLAEMITKEPHGHYHLAEWKTFFASAILFLLCMLMRERQSVGVCVCVWHFTEQYTLFLVHSTIYLIQVNECRKHTNDKSCDWLLFWESTHTPCLYLTDKTKSFKWFPFRLILPIFIHEEWMIKPKHFVYRNGPSIPDTLLCIF